MIDFVEGVAVGIASIMLFYSLPKRIEIKAFIEKPVAKDPCGDALTAVGATVGVDRIKSPVEYIPKTITYKVYLTDGEILTFSAQMVSLDGPQICFQIYERNGPSPTVAVLRASDVKYVLPLESEIKTPNAERRITAN